MCHMMLLLKSSFQSSCGEYGHVRGTQLFIELKMTICTLSGEKNLKIFILFCGLFLYLVFVVWLCFI